MKSWALAVVSVVASSATAIAQDTQPVAPVVATQPAVAPVVTSTPSVLAAGTPVIVMLNEELSTKTNHLGDGFSVTVLHDVVDQGRVIIPTGAIGHGEITFLTNKGGFGKPGILGIALRDLDLGGRKIALDGRYREEGGNNNGATLATWVAVGVFSGFIQGKAGVIPKGRELKARTGEDVTVTLAALPAAPPVAAIAPHK
jgi:hypothetical protein